MTTIAQQLADALQNLLDDTEGGVVTPDSVIADARALLAAYNDAARPLEVGDRVRVLAGSPHCDTVLGTGALGTVVEAPMGCFAVVSIDGNPFQKVMAGDGWTYAVKHLERIP